MIDYTYWLDKVRLNLKEDMIVYRGVSLNNYAHFFIGVQDMDTENEAKWQSFLAQYGAIEDRSVKWLFYPMGEIIAQISGDENELMLIGLASGATENYLDSHNIAHFYCEEAKLGEIGDILSLEDVEILHSITSYKPQGIVEMYNKEDAKNVYEFCASLAGQKFIVDFCADFGIGEYWIEEFEQTVTK